MKRKYFFFDIDGTLTERISRVMVPSAEEAVRKLTEAGHFVSICTGRAFYKAEPFRAAHGFTNMVCNGGHGIMIDGKLVENSPLPFEKALAVYRQATLLGYGVLTAIDDSEKVYTRDFKFYDQCGIRQEPTTYIIDEHFDPEKAGVIYKMYVSIPRAEEGRLTLMDTLGHMRFVEDYLMFQPDEKKDGIFRMLELVGGSAEDVVVFGDDTNDMVMFDERFYKVAMGNGNEELKKMANFVAPRNVDDGIMRTCEEHGWFQKVE